MNQLLIRERLIEAERTLGMITACCTECFASIRPAEELASQVLGQAATPPGSQTQPPATSGSGATGPEADIELHLGIGHAAIQLRTALGMWQHLSRKVVPSDVRDTVVGLFEASIAQLKAARYAITFGKGLALNLIQASHGFEAVHANVTQINENVEALTRTVQQALKPPPAQPTTE